MNKITISRPALFVGSYPARNADHGMREMWSFAHNAGVRLPYLPDAETGERNNWSRDENEALEGHPALHLAGAGKNYTNWDDLPGLEVINPVLLTSESIQARLSYAHYAAKGLEVLRDMQFFNQAMDSLLQAGVPTPYGLTMSVLGSRGLMYVPVFSEALIGEIEAIAALTDDVVIQLELPVETLLIGGDVNPQMPAEMQPPFILQSLLDFLRRLPKGIKIGLHFCFGDLNNTGRIERATADPSVIFCEKLLPSLPANVQLLYLMVPLAAGSNPPEHEPAAYAALRRLAGLLTSMDVQVYAGIAHERQGLEKQFQARDMAEAAYGGPLGISAPCGLGRRTRANARIVAQHTVELATA